MTIHCDACKEPLNKKGTLIAWKDRLDEGVIDIKFVHQKKERCNHAFDDTHLCSAGATYGEGWCVACTTRYFNSLEYESQTQKEKAMDILKQFPLLECEFASDPTVPPLPYHPMVDPSDGSLILMP